ncbi:MAG: glycosyltransferase family 9 protein [Proteobacteria bacterium]|nr:MAG: glycosyltransferase family 9 protein [Pseudomonadota bacterium]
MIVLGISLLRLGDLILQRPLIAGLKQQYPDCRIHLLINRQFAQVEFLFDGLVEKFIYFDREVLQKSCGDDQYNLFWGFNELTRFVSKINEVHYDRVYNLTHNRLTAQIAGAIKATKHVGIHAVRGEFKGLDNSWIQFFNAYFGKPEAIGFHYTELLARALKIPLSLAPVATHASARNKILIQPLTSDKKKNWDLEKLKSLARRLYQETDYQVVVLGAPFETKILEHYFKPSELAICDLREADQLLQSAALVVTGDTSIKHLAALRDVPILELSLGSSQPLQTGAFSNNSVILQPPVACGPCGHSQACSQLSQKCSEALSVQHVSEAVRIMLGIDKLTLSLYAQKYSELNVYRTEIRSDLGWTTEGLSNQSRNECDQILQRKMMISNELERRDTESTRRIENEQGTGKLFAASSEAS